MKKTLFFLNLILWSGILTAQEYNPYSPYTYIKQDSLKPVALDVWSMNHDHTEWGTRLKIRDEIVYQIKNYDESGIYFLLGWRGTYNFCYTKVEYMSNSIFPDTMYTDGDVELKQYDVRDFFANDISFVQQEENGPFILMVRTWVPGGEVDYKGNGILSDFNSQYRSYRAAKERDSETGKLVLLNQGDNLITNNLITFKFKSEKEAHLLIESIKKYGKQSDPYLGDPNPMTYTLDEKTNKKITLKQEHLISKYSYASLSIHDYLFVQDGKVWLGSVDTTKESETNRWRSTARFTSLPVANIDECEYQLVYDSRGKYLITLKSNTKMVADYYTFPENRRGICSQSIASKNKALGYTGQESMVFYMNSLEELKSFLAKIGKSSIPFKNAEE